MITMPNLREADWQSHVTAEIDFCISSKAVMIEEAVQEAMKAMYQGVMDFLLNDGT